MLAIATNVVQNNNIDREVIMKTYNTKANKYYITILAFSVAMAIAGIVLLILVHPAFASMIAVGGLGTLLFGYLVWNERNKSITLKEDVVIIPKESRRNNFELTKRFAVPYSKIQSLTEDTTRSTKHSLKCSNRYQMVMKDGTELGFKVEGISSTQEEIIIAVIKNRIE